MPKLTGKSLPVRTRCTPGCALAFSVLTSAMSAWGWGDRSRRMCSMRGSTISSAKRVSPVTLARPSTRRRGLPMTFMVHPPGGFLDRFEYLLVPGAAAQIAGDRLADRLARRGRVALEERLGRHQAAGRAVAALGGPEVGEGRLQGMEPGAARQAFDRLDAAALAFEHQHDAGELRLAVHQHGAGAALAELAAVLGAGQPEVFPQHLEQGLVRRDRSREGLAVHRQRELLAGLHCLGPKRIGGHSTAKCP